MSAVAVPSTADEATRLRAQLRSLQQRFDDAQAEAQQEEKRLRERLVGEKQRGVQLEEQRDYAARAEARA